MPQCKRCPEQFAQRIDRVEGDHPQSLAQHCLTLAVVQPEVQHRQIGKVLLIVVLGDAVFLHAELDMLPMNLQVRLDYSMMPVRPLPLEQHRV